MTGSSAWAIVESVGSSRLALSDTDAARMNASADRLAEALAADAPVYGLTSGFGPLARFPAGVDDNAQGLKRRILKIFAN
jgi:histidine ammonia-lyase